MKLTSLAVGRPSEGIMPRGRKRVAAPGGSARQVQLWTCTRVLKKPLEQIGTYIDVPGNYWQGCMSAEEKD